MTSSVEVLKHNWQLNTGRKKKGLFITPRGYNTRLWSLQGYISNNLLPTLPWTQLSTTHPLSNSPEETENTCLLYHQYQKYNHSRQACSAGYCRVQGLRLPVFFVCARGQSIGWNYESCWEKSQPFSPPHPTAQAHSPAWAYGSWKESRHFACPGKKLDQPASPTQQPFFHKHAPKYHSLPVNIPSLPMPSLPLAHKQ